MYKGRALATATHTQKEPTSMKARLIGLLSLTLVVAAALVAQGQGNGQRAGGPEGQRGAASRGPKRAVIVTGENSFNGHVWKDTSAELKNILDAGKDFPDVVIQPDPNFIATDEFLTFDVATSTSAIRIRCRSRRRSRPTCSGSSAARTRSRHRPLGQRRVPFWPDHQHRRRRSRACTTRVARSPSRS